MSKILFFCFLIVSLHLFVVKCEETLELDIVVSYDNGQSKLEVFKSKANDLIIKENKTYDYGKLKWYSIGHPLIIKSKSAKYKNESYFHFGGDGFFINVQMLTQMQKKTIIEEILAKYGIHVKLFQVEEFPLSSFDCDLHLINDDDEESIVKGSVKGLLTKPILRMAFKAQEKEFELLEYSLSESENDLVMGCSVKSNIGKERKIKLTLDKPSHVIKNNKLIN